MIAGNPWLTAIALALALVLGMGAVEVMSRAVTPLSHALMGG